MILVAVLGDTLFASYHVVVTYIEMLAGQVMYWCSDYLDYIN